MQPLPSGQRRHQNTLSAFRLDGTCRDILDGGSPRAPSGAENAAEPFQFPAGLQRRLVATVENCKPLPPCQRLMSEDRKNAELPPDSVVVLNSDSVFLSAAIVHSPWSHNSPVMSLNG